MLVTVTGNVAVVVPPKGEGLIWSTTLKDPKYCDLPQLVRGSP